jgi:two-component system, OmpR family, sensor kinase
VSPEAQLISRTWRRIWWQTSAVVSVAVMAVAGSAAALVLTTQHDAARQTVELAMDAAVTGTGSAGSLDPPAGVWVFQLRDGTVTASRGAPREPVDGPTLVAVAGGADSRPHEVERGPAEYLVDTRRVGPVTVQVVLDLTIQEDEQHRLYFALAAAGALGLGLAVVAGALIARRAIRPLGVAIERQRRFVADASHELRTPITQLHTRAQILSRALDAQDDRSEAAQDARQLVRGTRLMGEIVEEMLLAAQLRTEPDQFGPVDLAGLVEDVLAAHADRARERGVSLTASQGPGRYLVRGVPGALRRAVSALIDNALGHVGAAGRVVVTLELAPGEVVCSVRDNGVGFDPADAERIFERFARGSHGEGRRFGLGLALVREAVEAHGGRVDAVGSPGQGATFVIRLPAWAGPDAADGQLGHRPV